MFPKRFWVVIWDRPGWGEIRDRPGVSEAFLGGHSGSARSVLSLSFGIGRECPKPFWGETRDRPGVP